MTDPNNAARPSDQAVLKLQGISKSFGSLRANDDISLELAQGQVLALLGENGAGKSTLVSILFGHYVADQGSIEVFGQALTPGDPAESLARGIGMVHQHFTLADNLTVLDNIMVGTESLWRMGSSQKSARKKLLDTATQFGLYVDPDARVGDLSVGERQRVEILKTLYRGARILILDEPTAVLTPRESEDLFDTLNQLVADGLSIIFISHKLDEVLRVSDRIAVLRSGKLVATMDASSADRASLAETMVGRAVQAVSRQADSTATQGDVVCQIENAVVQINANRPALDNVNLSLRAGQIFAIAGVSGNGQQALADLLCGLLSLNSGSLTIDGASIAAKPREFTRRGIARIPEDRHDVGVVGDLPIWENAISERYHEPSLRSPAWLGAWLKRGKARAHANAIVQQFDVRGLDDGGLDQTTRSLSGGNMQKLILGRALSGAPDHVKPARLIIANQPTWGLDIGAVAYVHQQLIDAAQAGSAILLISEDLEEIFSIADTIAVMHAGHLSAPRLSADWSMADIGVAMAGGEGQNHAH